MPVVLSINYIVLAAIAVILALYRISCAKPRELLFLLAAALAAAALAYAEGSGIVVMLLGLLIFNGLAYSYGRKSNYAYILLAAMFVLFMQGAAQLDAQAMLLGLLSSSYLFAKRARRSSPRLETSRDLFQAALGIGFVAIFAIAGGPDAMHAIVYFVIAASLLANYAASSRKSKVSVFLRSLERKDAAFGQGAMWLVIGALVAVSFLPAELVLPVLAAIILGDAVATLAGTRWKIPLPYNRSKSLAGTAAYFGVAAAVSVPFVGPLALGIAALGAIVESLPVHFDDNFDTSLALTAALLLAIYLHLLL